MLFLQGYQCALSVSLKKFFFKTLKPKNGLEIVFLKAQIRNQTSGETKNQE